MILPCKHIFALRRHLQLELFDKMIVNQRWTMDYYKNNQRTLMSLIEDNESTENELPSTSNNNMSIPLTTQGYRPPSSYAQRRKKCLLLCNELADLAAQRTGMLFEQRFNLLKNLKTLWANDTAVLLTPIDVTDENGTQVVIESNDEIVFENEKKVHGEVVRQGISRVDNVNDNVEVQSMSFP